MAEITKKIGGFFTNKVEKMKSKITNGVTNYKALTGKEKAKWWQEFLLNNAIYIIFILFIMYVWIYCLVVQNANFLSSSSIMDLINKTAYSSFLALGVGGIIVLTGTDLSAGRILGLTACISAALLQRADWSNKMFPNIDPLPMFVVLMIVVAIGASIGFVNGFFTAKFKMHPFIVTLGTQLIVYGLTLMFVNSGNNGGVAINGLTDAYTNLIKGSVSLGGVSIPYYVFYAAIAIVVMWFIWNKTTLGKNMFAVGANPEAAHVSGVSVFWTTIIVFVIAGALYGISGFVEAARVGSNSASTGANAELNAIAACVIGGVSFSGGVGKISGIIAGVVLLNLVTVGLQWLGLAPYYTSIITGLIIIFAVAVDMRKYIAKK
ncbi:MAG: beta-methylgalactoside transporter [Bacillota bacterium]